MVFQNPQGISALNGSMLGRVTREDDPAIFPFSQVGYPSQCANTQQTCFVDPNHMTTDLLLQGGLDSRFSTRIAALSAGKMAAAANCKAGLGVVRQSHGSFPQELKPRFNFLHFTYELKPPAPFRLRHYQDLRRFVQIAAFWYYESTHGTRLPKLVLLSPVEHLRRV